MLLAPKRNRFVALRIRPEPQKNPLFSGFADLAQDVVGVLAEAG
jgi:hypothetical protein